MSKSLPQEMKISLEHLITCHFSSSIWERIDLAGAFIYKNWRDSTIHEWSCMLSFSPNLPISHLRATNLASYYSSS